MFCRAVEFYARRDVDKTSAEDKHLFAIGEMIEIGRRAGFEVRAFPNCSFDFWNQPEEGRRHADDFFSRSFRGYLEHVIGFGPEFGELWARTLGGHPRSWTAAPLAAPLPTTTLLSSATSDDRGIPPARG